MTVMLKKPHPSLLMKPLTQHVRMAMALLTAASINAHAQVSIETAKQDPVPSAIGTARAVALSDSPSKDAKAKVILPHSPSNPLP